MAFIFLKLDNIKAFRADKSRTIRLKTGITANALMLKNFGFPHTKNIILDNKSIINACTKYILKELLESQTVNLDNVISKLITPININNEAIATNGLNGAVNDKNDFPK